jgi:hypothetical protein
MENERLDGWFPGTALESAMDLPYSGIRQPPSNRATRAEGILT